MRTDQKRDGWDPQIGLWGLFDLDSYGAQLYSRIVARELRTRLGSCTIRRFAPFGEERFAAFATGEPVEPLPHWSQRRVRELAEQLDCVIIGGGKVVATTDDLAARYEITTAEMAEHDPSECFITGLGPDLERQCPVLWHSISLSPDVVDTRTRQLRAALEQRRYVAVADEPSRQAIEAAGLDREIIIPPSPALLLAHVLPRELLARRIDYLRLMGWYPERGGTIVIQASSRLLAVADELAPALREVLSEGNEHPEVTVLEVEPEDRGSADRFA